MSLASRKRIGLRGTLNDIADGWRLPVIWLNYAIYDSLSKYKRTALGPFWNSLTLLLIVLILGLVWSTIFGQDFREFLPRISVGYTVWWLISNIVSGATGTFTGVHRQIIVNSAVPTFCLVLRHVFSCLFLFLHHLAPVILILLILEVSISITQILVINGIVFIVLAGLPTTMVLGLLCARFRDFQVLVNTVMGVGIMISPVMWDLELLGDRAVYAYLNPFTAFLQLTKLPATGHMPSALDFYVAAGVTAVTWALALTLFARYRHKIVLWL